jgi:hypothetical protein
MLWRRVDSFLYSAAIPENVLDAVLRPCDAAETALQVEDFLRSMLDAGGGGQGVVQQ